MFAFFLNILRQKSGRYVCVQLLQTLNILFENISHETSLCKYLKAKQTSLIYIHNTMIIKRGNQLSLYKQSLSLIKISLFCLPRLPFVQQPRQLNNCAQV